MTAAPDRTVRTLDFSVLASAVVLSGIAVAIWGFGPEALAVAAGGGVAGANWVALRTLVGGLFLGDGRAPRKAGLAVLLGGKILAVVALVYALVAWAGLPAVPLAVGYSALVIGLLGGAALAVRSFPARDPAGGADA